MSASPLSRQALVEMLTLNESDVVSRLIAQADVSSEQLATISSKAEILINELREHDRPGLMEVFLEEYGLSTDEGVALMCLAEALLRVPDAETIDALIEDKIAPSAWGEHLGRSSSSLVNASTWGLMLTGKVLDDRTSKGVASVLRGALRRLGEPVIRVAVRRAMREMGAQFVLGQTIGDAMRRGAKQEAKGYTYSYDMLGEAALTWEDADFYRVKYAEAIAAIAQQCTSDDPRLNPGISIKLSALHPRYEQGQVESVIAHLVPRVTELALQASAANMGLTIDAEEVDRLELSLDVIEKVFSDSRLAGWDGFGVVVQAYGKRAAATIDWLAALATAHGRRIMIRLVKGAYWDSEIKHAQAEGLKEFAVFTSKAATDVSYIACAKKLFSCSQALYPQFATHNAHTMAAVLELAGESKDFEFQRLHGMGAALHERVKQQQQSACRIYAPVGIHRDLLAYLVRRLLENGANSSFVNQIIDDTIPAAVIAADPFAAIAAQADCSNSAIVPAAQLYAPERQNSAGWNLFDRAEQAQLEALRQPFADTFWHVEPSPELGGALQAALPIVNPARIAEQVGSVVEVTPAQVEVALQRAQDWSQSSAAQRAAALCRAADGYEQASGELMAALAREAGKTLADCVGELREAVDFLRYYAAQAEQQTCEPQGLFCCISPWNFPLAIFTGQIAAALAAGNGVLAKPAESTPISAMLAVKLLHSAGVPNDVLQLLPGSGSEIGGLLTSSPRISGVCFTGSTATAQHIHRTMAANLPVDAPLIAETGGLNAMLVDSTALPEQAVRDIIASAFQSAGQRCSALRVLYLQEEIAGTLLAMLKGAMQALQLGDPWLLCNDIGPVIDQRAQQGIDNHIAQARREGRVILELPRPRGGYFVGPTLIRVNSINELKSEIFGPVLHVATFKADQLENVVDAVNATGYGLTFGLHSRIDDRVETISQQIKAGNIYVNRNQIGAVVGSQPFGGEGLSGTGPKAGGPNYLARFGRYPAQLATLELQGKPLTKAVVQPALDAVNKRTRPTRPLAVFDLPGPTGESNRLSYHPRGTVLCLGPTPEQAQQQAQIAQANGCRALQITSGATGSDALDGQLTAELLTEINGFAVVVYWGDETVKRALRQALAARRGALLPLVTHQGLAAYCLLERHLCIDTTAAGGNAALLAMASCQ